MVPASDPAMTEQPILSFRAVAKQYPKGPTALRDISLDLPRGAVAGLIGRNGSGKTTFMHSAIGLLVPTAGEIHTFGVRADRLVDAEMARLGCVYQEATYLEWMSVGEQLDFVASFHRQWDTARVERLVRVLQLDRKARIARLPPGDLQKLSLVLAVAHHPELLLLDEPVSALDPIARGEMLAFLMELLREDGCTIVVSSHVLRDIEAIVDHIVCLDAGDLLAAGPLEDVLERFEEWTLESATGKLPGVGAVPVGVIEARGEGRQARWVVDLRQRASLESQVSGQFGAVVNGRRALNLERAYPVLLRAEGRMA